MIHQTRRQHLAMLAAAGLTGVAGRAFAAMLADEPYKSPPLEGFTESALIRVCEAAGVPGMATAYADKGGKAVLLADGLRSIDGTARVTRSDLWHIGSMTKSMTSTLVARMVEHGGISWDTTIDEILGSSVPTMQESYKRATLRHLCSHHAGLPRDPIDLGDAAKAGFPEKSPADPHPDRLRFAAMALEEAPIGAPGEKMLYSNSGYEIAATMLEVVFKKPWEKLIVAQVFEPLKLRSTGFGPPGTPGKLDQPLGHRLPKDAVRLVPAVLGNPDKPADLPAVIGPAGLVHISPADMILYLNAHLLGPESFLKAESWTILHTPPYTADYAMGWVKRPDGSIWHNGSNGRWYTEMLVDQARGRVAFVGSNDGYRDKSGPAVAAVLKGAMEASA
jgi:CubicO group peptidase (beta-lactamase class C family)